MSESATEQVKTPGVVMLAAGAVFVLFYAGYALWSGVSLLFGCMGSSVYIMAALDSGDAGTIFGLGCSMWGLLLNGVGFLVYLALAAGGAWVATGGMSMQNLENLEKAKKCVMAAAAIPVVGILMNLLSTVGSLSFCGALTGTIPQLIPLILGIAAAFLANTALSDESVAGAFK
ncbi:MAG: hypothetical protein R3F61_05250 [Myxococcota bacterium]